MKIPKLLVKKLADDAILPRKDRSSDEGYDIYSNEEILITSGRVTKVKTGISGVAVNTEWHYGNGKTKEVHTNDFWIQIEGRSGLASKGIFPVGGIVDSGYTGELCVMLANLSGFDYVVKKHDKIAQLIIRDRHNVDVMEVNELPKGDRGQQGFGSSGN